MPIQSRPVLLLTRPAAASARFAAQVAQRLGDRVDLLISPLMAPQWLAAPLPDRIPAGILFTSETGVEALSAQVSWRVPAICVGPHTAKMAQANGWPARALGGDAAHMVAALRENPLSGHWLHARGQDAAAPLAKILGEAGMDVSEAILYAQAPVPLAPQIHQDLSQSTQALILAIFSPRSGRLLLDQLPAIEAHRLSIAAISPAAAQVMEPLGAPRVALAERPDGPAMLEAIQSLVQSVG